ncbi:uncharacterized protein T551_00343 [Pneumocystis jirovecii RU7]|uniref:Zinc finger PHD-type domain-containing protein n=1 Tax=Pneumocystis jirovecii (strain RU7) TaxID=1408657 RepID=A0A0W4ZV49_PNEJ7|nr:uncharacterized protein T551_00343 [Pneumocystis jirovecii RU7]KTW32252.1 hypothetical protein T551_00343 [Pneumocystis jirovecii RU7]
MIYRKNKETDSVIHALRNMPEFAILSQFLFLFHKILKLDDFDIEFFEQELLGFHEPHTLTIIRYGLVRYLSSNRHINAENVDFYTRKQFLLRKPENNPYGDKEIPYSWDSFDIFTKVQVLLQLCEWQLLNPEKFRERVGAKESDEVTWRIDPIGYDSLGYTYYLLDDNRLYRHLDTFRRLPNEKSRKNDTKYKKRKRRRIVDDDDLDLIDISTTDDKKIQSPQIGHWENVCVTFNDWKNFVNSISHSKNKNEHTLYNYLQKNILPYLQENEEKKEKERLLKERERLKAEAIVHRKKSTRIEQRKLMKLQEEEKRLEQEQLAMLIEIKKREENQLIEYDRKLRMETRDRKQKEKLLKELLQKENSEKIDISNFNNSSNTLKTNPIKRKSTKKVKRKNIKNKKIKNTDWIFNCVCGISGKNYLDNELMIACDQCMVWEHVKCQHNADEIFLKLQEQPNENNGIPFICTKCSQSSKETHEYPIDVINENKSKTSENTLYESFDKMIIPNPAEKIVPNNNVNMINKYTSKICSNVHSISGSFGTNTCHQSQISYSQIANFPAFQQNNMQAFKPFYPLESSLHIQNISSSFEEYSQQNFQVI